MKDFLNVDIFNCANIVEGKISIHPNTINIKFGHNGVGKTTVLKSLNMAIDGSFKKELIPYSKVGIPTVKGVDSLSNIITFNEDYIEQFLFDSGDLLKNSHEWIVTSDPDFKKNSKLIGVRLDHLQKSINDDQDLLALITTLTGFTTSIKLKKDGSIREDCQIIKGFKNGNNIKNKPKISSVYEDLVSTPSWITWFKNGHTYKNILGDVCPYCGGDLCENKNDRITKTADSYDSNQIKHLVKSLDIILEVDSLLDDTKTETLNNIKNSSNELTTDEKQYIVKIYNEANQLLDRLLFIKNADYNLFKTIPISDLVSNIQKLKIDFNLYTLFDSNLIKEVSKNINKEVDNLISEVTTFQNEMAKHNRRINEIVEEYETDINDFLEYAGFKYKIRMEEVDDLFKLVLYPDESNIDVKDVGAHLSYGEKNVFAIALFLYQAINGDYDLIVLDDPISSFDKNKKFAIIHKLFKGKFSLNNKTVILATHDFETVIDLCYVKANKYDVSTKFLMNKKGTLTELDIHKKDIMSFKQICDYNIKNSTNSLVKLIHIRRLLDISKYSNIEETLVWNYISSILHLKKSPDILKNDYYDEDRSMTVDEIKQCQEYLNHEFQFNIESYESLISSIDLDYLVSAYNNESSNYSKLQIYRVMLNELNIPKNKESHRDSIFNKFINETYHTENDFLFDLNPMTFDKVPDYIIDKCDRSINEWTK